MWAKRKVVLDELDLEIRKNFERRGRLPLMDIDHPPPATLIREFYSNLSVHSKIPTLSLLIVGYEVMSMSLLLR